MQDLLLECIANFSLPPRKIRLWDRLWYLRIPHPYFVIANKEEKLNVHFQNLKELFRDGIVVWGYIIQANQHLFTAGSRDLPGEVVYSLDEKVTIDPIALSKIAWSIGRLKGTQPTQPNLQRIAEYLTDEYIRVFGLPVPESISPDFPCRISTTYFVRKHLPLRKLCKPLLPMIVHPRNPFIATSLPARYWPKELLQWWQS